MNTRVISNPCAPPLTALPAVNRMNYKILCVFPEDRCLGPLVAAHLRRQTPYLWILSAALEEVEQVTAHPNAMLAGVSQGLNLWGERSREVDESLCDWADRILVWGTDDLERLQQQLPGAGHKLLSLDTDGLLAPWTHSCDEAALRNRLPAIEALASQWTRRMDETDAPVRDRACRAVASGRRALRRPAR